MRPPQSPLLPPCQVLLDWTLLRHALENAIANAHKYGCAGGETELAVEYCEPRLRIVVTNAADEQRQASRGCTVPTT